MEDFVKRIKEKPLLEIIKLPEEGIEMRLLSVDNKEKHFEIIMRNKDFLKKTLPWANFYKTIDDSINFLTQFEKFQQERTNIGYLIWKEEQILGCIALQELQIEKKQSQFGYWLSQECIGKGVMSKCVKRLMEYAFQDLELQKLIIKCIVANQKSANIPIRLGFTEKEQEKDLLVIDEVSHDARVFEITLEDYQNNNSIKKQDLQ